MRKNLHIIAHFDIYEREDEGVRQRATLNKQNMNIKCFRYGVRPRSLCSLASPFFLNAVNSFFFLWIINFYYCVVHKLFAHSVCFCNEFFSLSIAVCVHFFILCLCWVHINTKASEIETFVHWESSINSPIYLIDLGPIALYICDAFIAIMPCAFHFCSLRFGSFGARISVYVATNTIRWLIFIFVLHENFFLFIPWRNTSFPFISAKMFIFFSF